MRRSLVLLIASAVACGRSTEPVLLSDQSAVGTYALLDTLDGFGVWHPVSGGSLSLTADHHYSWSIPMPNATGEAQHSGDWEMNQFQPNTGGAVPMLMIFGSSSALENWFAFSSTDVARAIQQEPPPGATLVASLGAFFGAQMYAFAKE